VLQEAQSGPPVPQTLSTLGLDPIEGTENLPKSPTKTKFTKTGVTPQEKKTLDLRGDRLKQLQTMVDKADSDFNRLPDELKEEFVILRNSLRKDLPQLKIDEETVGQAIHQKFPQIFGGGRKGEKVITEVDVPETPQKVYKSAGEILDDTKLSPSDAKKLIIKKFPNSEEAKFLLGK